MSAIFFSEPSVSSTDAIADRIASYQTLRATADDSLGRRWLLNQLAGKSAIEWVKTIIALEASSEGKGSSSWLAEEARNSFADPVAFRYLLGIELRAAGHIVYAESTLRSVFESNPSNVEVAFTLAELLRESGRLNAARDVLVALARRLPTDNPQPFFRCAVFLNQCQRAFEAYSICESGLASGVPHEQLRFLAGELALTLGKFDEARSHILDVLEKHEPSFPGFALLALADAQRYQTADHPDFSLFRAALTNPAIAGVQRASVQFALGKALDDVGDYASASSAWRAANQWMRDETHWSASAWTRFCEQQMRSPLPRFAVPAIDDFVPVMIVGMPRSGTTLLTQMLARHPSVRARGETNWLPYIWEQLAFAGLREDPGALYQGSRLYYAHVRQDDSHATHYVDKNPLNFRYLNLLVSMFPNARVIHCRRSIQDTALSIYSHQFSQGSIEFAYDFSDIGVVAQTCEDLMTHWKRVLPLQILTVDYEQLVRSPQSTISEIQHFVGLPSHATDGRTVDAATEAPVITSSRWQARQPLYDRAIGRSEHYRQYLPELMVLPEPYRR